MVLSPFSQSGLFQVIYPICWSEFVCRGEGIHAVLDCMKSVVNLIQYVTWQGPRRHQEKVQDIPLMRELPCFPTEG